MWYCKECKRELDNTEVTFSEHCDVCGNIAYNIDEKEFDLVKSLQSQLTEAQEQIENMKCCGNCANYENEYSCPNMNIDNSVGFFEATEPCRVCDKWASDNIPKKQRKI